MDPTTQLSPTRSSPDQANSLRSSTASSIDSLIQEVSQEQSVTETALTALKTLTPKTSHDIPRSLEGRVTQESPIHAFKTEIEDAKIKSDAEIKSSQKNITNVKIKKVATIALIGLAGVLIVAGVAAACAFCPPIGAVILVVGLTVIASGGIGAGIYNWPMDAPKEDREKMEQAGKDLDKALSLFEKYPKTGNSDGTSFEEFLEDECPITYDETLQAPSYKLEDIGKYVSLFEKKLKLQEKVKEKNRLEEKINTLKSENNQLASELETSTITGLETSTITETETEIEIDCQQEIADLMQNNLVLKLDSGSVVNPHATEVLDQEELSEKEQTIKENEEKISRLTRLQEQFTTLKEISLQLESINQEISDLQSDYQQSKDNLAREIQNESAAPYTSPDTRTNESAASYTGPDTRITDPKLDKWLKTNVTLPLPTTTIDIKRDGNSIYTFGTLAEQKTHGIYVQGNPEFQGHSLGFSNEAYQALGRTPKNNFLSNSYIGTRNPLTIDNKTYQSVTHYMLLTKLDRLPEPSDPKEKAHLNRLKKEVANANSAEYALLLIKQIPEMNQNPEGIFSEMDQDLKRALFYKFVAPNGDLTEEGRKLLETGNKTLYAGHERGDSSYGVQFINQDKMRGQNKLGIYLMELRKQLKEDQNTRTAQALPNPQQIQVEETQEIQVEEIQAEEGKEKIQAEEGKTEFFDAREK